MSTESDEIMELAQPVGVPPLQFSLASTPPTEDATFDIVQSDLCAAFKDAIMAFEDAIIKGTVIPAHSATNWPPAAGEGLTLKSLNAGIARMRLNDRYAAEDAVMEQLKQDLGG